MVPQNVILHPMGQVAPPTLDVFLPMHLHWCTYPKGPRAAVNPMEEGCHVHPQRGAGVPLQEAHGIQAAIHVLPQQQVDRAVQQDCVLNLVLLLFEQGLSRQVLEESVVSRLELVVCVTLSIPPQSPTTCVSSSTRTYGCPLGDITEDDPQKAGFHNVPQWILHMHCHIILPSVGQDALKVKQLVSTAK